MWRHQLRKNGGAALLVGAALGSVLWVMHDRKGISDKEREDRKALLFPSFRRAELRGITLHQGTRSDTYAKDERGWHLLEEKTKEDADDASLESLATRLEYAIPLRKVDDALLGPVRLRGGLDFGSIQYAFQVGGETATPVGGAYVHIEREGTFVVGREVALELLQSLDTYHNRNIVPYLSIELAELRVSGGHPWKIERANEIDFALSYTPEDSPPVRARASRKGLDTFWGGLAELRASTFFEAKPASAPVLSIEFVPKAGGTLGKLEIFDRCGDKEGEILVRRTAPPPEKSICVPSARLAPLAKPPIEFLDEAVFSSRMDEISELRWSTTSGPSVEISRFARSGATWRYQRIQKRGSTSIPDAAPDASVDKEFDNRELAPFEAAQLQRVIEGLLRAKARPYQGPPHDLPPGQSVTLVRGDETEEVHFHSAALDQDSAAFELLRSNAKFPSWPSPSTLAPYDQTYFIPPRLRGASPWSTPYRNADVTHMRSRCGAQEQTTKREGGIFRLAEVSGKKYPADHARVLDIADAVSTLKVLRWVEWPYSHRQDESLPCAPATLRRLVVDHDGRSDALLFCAPLDTESGGGRTLGTFDETALPATERGHLLFEFDGEPLKDMCRLWIDRGELRVEPRNLKRVTLSGTEKSHSFVEGETVGTLRARDVFEQAGLLHATEVLSTGSLPGERVVFTASFEFEPEAGAGKKRIHFYAHAKGFAASVDPSPVRYGVAEAMISPWLSLFQPIAKKTP